MVIEGWGLLDSFYMTIITIAAVGYREVHEISVIGRIFTIVVIFTGVGFTLYVAAAVVQFMVEGRIRDIMGRKRLDRKINRMKNHYIVCGYGRIGRVLCRDLGRASMNLVIIEKNPDLVRVMDQDGILYISGEATDEANLRKAGIERAKGLIAALATDTENVFLVLTARQLAPDLQIIARASQEGSKAKLKAAGANSVESPYEMGAVSMAHHIIRPTVTTFLDLAFEHKRRDIQMEEIPVSPSSELVNVMLKDSGIRQMFNLIIIAIKNPDGEMMFNPSFEAVIQPEDTVIAVGEADNLQKLEQILNPPGSGQR
jgi:voltage-gated potassium channel